MEGSSAAICPECSTKNLAGTTFCESCGLKLDVAPAPRAAGSGRRGRKPSPARTERLEIERKLRKARGVLKSMRMLFVVLAVASMLFLASAFAAESAFEEGSDGMSYVHVLQMVLGVQTLLLIVGAVFLYAQPLFFSLLLACVLTVGVLIQGWIAWESGDFSVGLVVNVFVVLSLWCAVSIVGRVAALQREYPDLVDTTALKTRQRFDKTPTGAALARAETKRGVAQRARLRTVGIVVGALAISLAAYFPISAAMRSDSASKKFEEKTFSVAELASIEAQLQPAVRRFAARWVADDREAVKQMFTSEKQRSFWPKIERFLRKYGWFDDLPMIRGEAKRRPGTVEGQDMWFDMVPQGTLKTRWVWEDERWQLSRLRAADFK